MKICWAVLATFLFSLVSTVACSEDVTVFAAASLTEALSDVASAWHAAGHDRPTLNFAASSALARQIDQGAKAGLFVSADERWMDWAQQRGLIVSETRHDIVGNELVVIVNKDHFHEIVINSSLNLDDLLGKDGRLAVGDPESVPAGIYAQEALEALGLWSIAEPRLARAENVRSALQLVVRGEASAGIVYATDAAASSEVRVAGVFPSSTHKPIRYPAAVVQSGDTLAARSLMAFLATPVAGAIFRSRGFTTID